MHLFFIDRIQKDHQHQEKQFWWRQNHQLKVWHPVTRIPWINSFLSAYQKHQWSCSCPSVILWSHEMVIQQQCPESLYHRMLTNIPFHLLWCLLWQGSYRRLFLESCLLSLPFPSCFICLISRRAIQGHHLDFQNVVFG